MMHKIAYQCQGTFGPCAHRALLGIIRHMVLRHKNAQRGPTGPPNHGQRVLAHGTSVPQRSRVTNPSRDVRRQVKVARSERGWTQTELAKAAKVSRGSVQNLENGMRLDESTEAKIESALGKPAGWLDQLRASAASSSEDAPPPLIDPDSATLADLQREYVHFMSVLSPPDMARLYRLCELYHQLQVRIAGHERGERSHA